MSSPGFMNIRAMFEQNKAQPASGATTPNRDMSPKPLARVVRASFVAVTGNGGVGLIKAGSPIAGSTPEVSIAEAAKLAGEVVEKDNAAQPVEEKEKKEQQVSAIKTEDIQAPVEDMKSEPEVKTEEEPKAELESTPPAPKETAKPSSEKLSSKLMKATTDTKTQQKPKTASSTSKPTAEKKVAVKAPMEKKPVKPVEEKKVVEKKAVVPTTKPAVTRPASSKPASSKPAVTSTIKATSTMPPPATKPAAKNISLLASSSTKKSSSSTPLPSPRVPVALKTATAPKPAASTASKPPRASDKSSAALPPKVRASTATGHRSKTPTVSDAPRKTATTTSSISRLFAPTAASQARAEEKEKAKTVASSTATKRPASVATNRPKSSLSTARYGESKVTSSTAPRTGTTAKSASVKKPAAKATPVEAPKAEAAAIPPPPSEEVLERVTRPTAASAQKVVSKEELAEIHSRTSSRMSGGSHSRRVSVGSTSSALGSPGKRRLSSQSPPRVVISPAQALNGEEPPVIEEKPEEEQEEAAETSTEEEKTKPSALEISAAENVEPQDVTTPTSETTLVQEGEAEGEVAEKVEEEVSASA